MGQRFHQLCVSVAGATLHKINNITATKTQNTVAPITPTDRTVPTIVSPAATAMNMIKSMASAPVTASVGSFLMSSTAV